MAQQQTDPAGTLYVSGPDTWLKSVFSTLEALYPEELVTSHEGDRMADVSVDVDYPDSFVQAALDQLAYNCRDEISWRWFKWNTEQPYNYRMEDGRGLDDAHTLASMGDTSLADLGLTRQIAERWDEIIALQQRDDEEERRFLDQMSRG